MVRLHAKECGQPEPLIRVLVETGTHDVGEWGCTGLILVIIKEPVRTVLQSEELRVKRHAFSLLTLTVNSV